jgi:cytochrome P450
MFEILQMIGASTGFASLPFGHGVRNCIGKKIAEQAIRELVTETLSKFRLNDLNSTESVDMTMRFTGIPDKEIQIGIRRRE